MKKKTKKKIYWSIGTLLSFLVAADFSGATYLFNYALQPQKRTEKEGLARLYERRPDLKQWVDSLKASKAWHDTICTINGHRAHATFIPAAIPTTKTAVLVHGYKDNNMSMMHIAELYNRQMGFNVLLPDLYAHGASEGNFIRMGWLDRLDVMQWMNIANALFGTKAKPTQMVVHGVSMGAATTMCVSGEKQKPFVKCFVEDCGYTSVHDEFAHQLREMFDLPSWPLLPTASLICKMRNGWDFEEASPLEQVKKCRLPMLFIHGDADTFVPYSMLKPLYDAHPGEKQIFIAKGTKHARSLDDHPEEYACAVKSFVGRYISSND